MNRNEGRHIIQEFAQVIGREEPAEGIFVLRLRSEHLSRHARPGQFLNIRCGEGCLPLLRRPFSISRIENDVVQLLFNVIGHGTRMLAARKPGDQLDILGPLGVPFGYQGTFETALLVGGGLGVAPLPFLTDALLREGKNVLTFVGARSARQVVREGLKEVNVATDDGTMGTHGTVIDGLRNFLEQHPVNNGKIFGCGPTKMLQALAQFAQSHGIDCELSLEGDMACGMGLCQGCPVERADGKKKYALVCVDGPTFNCNDIVIR